MEIWKKPNIFVCSLPMFAAVYVLTRQFLFVWHLIDWVHSPAGWIHALVLYAVSNLGRWLKAHLCSTLDTDKAVLRYPAFISSLFLKVSKKLTDTLQYHQKLWGQCRAMRKKKTKQMVTANRSAYPTGALCKFPCLKRRVTRAISLVGNTNRRNI